MSYTGGNPNTYKGYTMSWEKGRQLKGMTKSGTSLSFEYNAAGVRTKKTADEIVHNYYLNGMNILFETIECATTVDVLEYVYDHNGETAGIKYNGDTYLYEKNLQGDVIRLLDIEGQVVVNYTYDAWGKVEKITDANGVDLSSDATHIANVNPIRYRSYYYDTETQLYYLQSRYYDPETGRFINADDPIWVGITGIIESPNLFVYCENNPTNQKDETGHEVILSATLVGAIIACVFLCLALLWLFNSQVYKNAINNLSRLLSDAAVNIGQNIKRGKAAVKEWLNSLITYFLLKVTKKLKDVKQKKPDPNDKVYQAAYINKYDCLVKHYRKLTYDEAVKVLKNNKTLNTIINWWPSDRKNFRGIYTKEQAYAKALAYIFDAGFSGPEVHGNGAYGHYHDSKHKYHVWFGGQLYFG